MNRYINIEDANMRLRGSIIRYQEQPVYVDFIEDDIDFTMSLILLTPDSLSRDNPIKHFASANDDRDVDISSIPLGWGCNAKGRSMYFMRSPGQYQRQGIDINRVFYYSPATSEEPGTTHRGLSLHKWSTLRPVVATVNNDFKSLSEALESPLGAPFHPKWAVIKAKKNAPFATVYHRFVPIGSVHVKSRNFLFQRNAMTKTRKLQLKGLLDADDKEYTLNEQS